MFEEMEEKDLHLGSVLQTRKLQVIGLEYEILPAATGGADKKIAAAAKTMLEGIENLDDALLDLADAIGKGFSVLEIMWEISGNEVYITELKHVHQKRFTFNQREIISTMPYLLTQASPMWGEELIANKFVVHRYRSRSGITPRAGLLRPCAYAYIFKNYNIKDWLIFNELFSTPMRMGKYQPGASKDEIAVLKQAVFNMG
ncbi:phage portal protein family protein, partial [Candidatus Magnetominusculus dajiuhuensis]|uniref:phage portal protein family protein n=1 Tax=Candidatus Magnetominusculus dajiuhuensis TaxID=3137712 RepID=UPI003B4294E1